jgi:parallel beta-helix repeat protein
MGWRLALSTTLLLPLAVAPGCSGDSDGGAIDPPILRVGPPGSGVYESIQEAVDEAAGGSTILVEAGTYVERVDVSKSLTIVGSGPDTVVEYPASGPSDSAVITVRDVSGLRIEALAVRASQPDVDGIRVRDATAVVLRSIVASGNTEDGVDVRRSSGIEISSGTFERNGGDGIQVDEASSGITIASSRAAWNVGDGFKISLCSGVVVRNSVATVNGDDGIQVSDSNHVEVLDNTVTSNLGWGIVVSASPDTVLARNAVAGNSDGDVKCEPDPCP